MKQVITLAVCSLASAVALAGAPAVKGPFSFEPLLESGTPGSEPACAPFKLPEGFEQVVLVDELV